nr:MAG TPA: hypothetical protein [Bacteriophage sp.]
MGICRVGGLIMIITGMDHFQSVCKKKLTNTCHTEE